MELRPAELDDLRVCAAIPQSVRSNYVWQFAVERDPSGAPMTSEWSITLRCQRLPREVVVEPPGARLDVVWKRAAAVFVAGEEETLLGFVALARVDERPAAHVARLVVAPAARRRGVGRALVRAAAQWANTEGLTALTAHCSARNHPAVKFYGRAGFSFSGCSVSYYPRGEAALFWERPL
jgi:ribosomal protein S18 acetylase RimI-like enzyme